MIDSSDLMKRAKRAEISIEKLKLHTANPRLQHILKEVSEKEAEEFFWSDPSQGTSELYDQVKAAKGIYEDLIVIESKTRGEFVTLEGNRRLVVLRRLNERAQKGELDNVPKNQFAKVMCRILPNDAERREINLLLGSIHIKGKKDWRPFNKAKAVYILHEIDKFSYDKLKENLGMAKSSIIRMVDAYGATLAYAHMYPTDKYWVERFTYFDELYKRRDLKDFRNIPDNVKLFSEWIHSNKFKNDVRLIRRLRRVLDDAEAMKVFERQNIEAALEVVERKDPTINSPEFHRLKDAIDTMRALSRKEIVKTAKDEARMEIVRTLKKEAQSLLHDLDEMRKKK